jgi:23S rRNA pseudouridine2605 synthase
VKVDGHRVFVEHFQYFLFHKPEGVMSTLDDPEGRAHLGDVVRKLGAGRLYPVGRLDFATSGLLLLTNDGDLTQKLLHPRFQVERQYEAKVQGILSDAEFMKMATGVRLEDGWAKAEVSPIRRMETNSYVKVLVREGRNRLVRRIFEAMGHPIVKLQRVGFGPLLLDRMPPGEIRRMSPEEVKALKAFAARGNPPAGAKGSPKAAGKAPVRGAKPDSGSREGRGPGKGPGKSFDKGPRKPFGKGPGKGFSKSPAKDVGKGLRTPAGYSDRPYSGPPKKGRSSLQGRGRGSFRVK